MTLFIQYTKKPAFTKWLPFELICAVYLEYIVTSSFVRPYPTLLTLYVQYTKNQAVKNWPPFFAYIYNILQEYLYNLQGKIFF